MRARPLGARARSTSAWVDGFCGGVGNTPLMRLTHVSEETQCNVLAKCEFLNPGGSVKDRAALFLIRDAEEKGILKPGGTVVEGTAGNTGIGLAHICNARGYKCVIYMPDTQSHEKMDLLRTLGADVRAVPAVPITDPKNYNHQARDFAAETPGALWTDQFDNTANRAGHERTTGPEIWEQTGGEVDAFTCVTGTGGTLGGVARFLQAKKPEVQIVLADPPGSVLYSWVSSGGKTMERHGSSITEGIGQGRVTENLRGTRIDGALQVPDEDTVTTVFRLLHDEGLFVGASTAANVCAARSVAHSLGPGHTVVTVLCDGGYRYQSRLFNRAWLESKGLLHCVPEDCQHLLA